MEQTNLQILFARIAMGEKAAFQTVFLEFYDDIYSTSLAYCKSPELADDITQQVFLKLWERREILAQVEQPRSWLFTAARYQALYAIKREMERKDFLTRALDWHGNHTTGIQHSQKLAEQKAAIQVLVSALPERQRKIYQLSREEGLTYVEIAQLLKLSHETVKDYMSKALKSLKKALNDRKDELFTLLFFIFSIFF